MCNKCSTGSYCPGGTQQVECPENSDSKAGASSSDDCVCPAGQYAGEGNPFTCKLCPPNSYCVGDNSRVECGDARKSKEGSDEESDCKMPCAPGTYKGFEGGCKECPEDSYCVGEVKQPCPLGYKAEKGSKSTDDCRAPPPPPPPPAPKPTTVQEIRESGTIVPTCSNSGQVAIFYQHCWQSKADEQPESLISHTSTLLQTSLAQFTMLGDWKSRLVPGKYATIGSSCDNDEGMCVVRDCGMKGGDLSSIDIPSGWRVELYDRPNFQGNKLELRGPMDAHQHCLVKYSSPGRGHWNDAVQSVKVYNY